MARPTKLNEEFLKKAEKVLWNDNLVLFTDEELVDEINDELEPDQQISTRTFIRWKKADFEEKGEIGLKFCHLMKKALRDQKANLFEKYQNEKGAWQKWAWIIERKFSEWNLKNINENNTNISGTVQNNNVDLNNLAEDDLSKLLEIKKKLGE